MKSYENYSYSAFFNPLSSPDPLVVPAHSINQFYTWDALLKQQDLFKAQAPSLLLRSLSYRADYSGGACFIAVFAEVSGGAQGFFSNQDWEVFETNFNNSNLHLADLTIQWRSDNPNSEPSTPRFISIWDGWGDRIPVKQSMLSGDTMDWYNFNKQMTIRIQAGERLVKIRAYPAAGTFHLIGIFEESKTPGASSLVRWTEKEFNAAVNTLNTIWNYIGDLEVIDIDGDRFYLVIIDDDAPEMFRGIVE